MNPLLHVFYPLAVCHNIKGFDYYRRFGTDFFSFFFFFFTGWIAATAHTVAHSRKYRMCFCIICWIFKKSKIGYRTISIFSIIGDKIRIVKLFISLVEFEHQSEWLPYHVLQCVLNLYLMFDYHIVFYCICSSFNKIIIITTIFDRQIFSWLDVPYRIGIRDRLIFKNKMVLEPNVSPHKQIIKDDDVKKCISIE